MCIRDRLKYRQYRHFICESSLFYFVEQELEKLVGGGQILFDSAFEYGRELAEFQTDSVKEVAKKYVMDYLSAIGFGDVHIRERNGFELISHYFPWTELADEINFSLFRGLASGLMTGLLGKNVMFNEFTKNTSTEDGFTFASAEN
mgnify:CR=1 FL=1